MRVNVVTEKQLNIGDLQFTITIFVVWLAPDNQRDTYICVLDNYLHLWSSSGSGSYPLSLAINKLIIGLLICRDVY